MNLSLQIIFEEMKAHQIGQAIFHDDPLERRLTGVIPYNGEYTPKGDRLYVAYGKDLRISLDDSDTPSFVVIGKPSDHLPTGKINLLQIDEDISLINLLSEISEIFIHYHNWYAELHDVVTQYRPMQEIGRVAEEIIKNPIHLIDSNYTWIFSSVNAEHYSLPPDYLADANTRVMKKMLSLPEFDNMQSRTTPYYIYRDSFREFGFNYDSLCCNVFREKQFFATVYTDSVGHDFNDKDRALLLVIRDTLSDYIASHILPEFNGSLEQENAAKKILNEQMVEESMLRRILHSSGWDIENQYVCIRVELPRASHTETLLYMLGENIVNHISACMKTIHQGGLVLLLNLTHLIEPYQYVIDYIEGQVTDCGMTAGVSEIFSNFYSLIYSQKHAKAAMNLGTQKCENATLYFFEDILLEYMQAKCLADDPIGSICPPGLLELARQDKNKDTHDLAVLRYYLENNMNAADTARAFFVHRNTMMYRLQRIEKTLNMDLTDGDVRLLLLWALRLLEYDSSSNL